MTVVLDGFGVLPCFSISQLKFVKSRCVCVFSKVIWPLFPTGGGKGTEQTLLSRWRQSSSFLPWLLHGITEVERDL